MKYLLVDTSNVVKAGLFNGHDAENGYKVRHPETDKEVYVNSAEWGFDSAVRFLKARLEQFNLKPVNMIFVVEQPSANALRKFISDTYKAGRSDRYVQQQHDEVDKAKAMLLQQFKDLGALQVTQPGLEADDIIAYLAEKLPSCVILSTDGDMQQCVDERAHLFYNNQIDHNRYGDFPMEYTTLYKALVGDQSDNIKGAKGFGEKAFLDLYCIFGDEGLAAMQQGILQHKLEDLHENVPELKSLQRVIDDREGVYLSWKLAVMYPENVNTWRAPLQWTAGMVRPMNKDTHPDLREYAARKKIVHAANFDTTMEWLRSEIAGAGVVFLDIETSGCDEGDEWLERKKRKNADPDDLGVDVFGAKLTSFSLTLGGNDNYTMYFTVDHVEEPGVANITLAQAAEALRLLPPNAHCVVHNSSFEISVLARELLLAIDNGWFGYVPNVLDTRIMQSYVDEEEDQGLKEMSATHLSYTQITYDEVTQGRRMNQMRAAEAFDYGCDDTICTAAHYRRLLPIIEIEGTWDTMIEVEQAAAYMGAVKFNQGTHLSMERLLQLEREDQEAYDRGWVILREYLMANGWEGTVLPQLASAAELTPKFIKDAYSIVTGVPREKDDRTESDVFLDTRDRLTEKLAVTLESVGQELLAGAVRQAAAGDVSTLNALIKLHFKGEPDFNLNSPVQMCRLMYEVMKCPIRIRNNATEKQRAAGQKEGNPKADDYAMQWAAQDDLKPGTPEYAALKALQGMKIAATRRQLYYDPYKNFPHWKDGKIHSTLTQCGPVTRRYSSSAPNEQQWPKHPKATGEKPKFRETIVPHHPRAVIVSMDEDSQELRIIADLSKDSGMLECFGEQRKSMHTMTALEILKKKIAAGRKQQLWTMAGKDGEPGPSFEQHIANWRALDYALFEAFKKDEEWVGLFNNLRPLGKKTNFTTEYGAQRKKLSQTLLVPEDEAQEYLDARKNAFPRAEQWKRERAEGLHSIGYALTMMGARRHLHRALLSNNKYDVLAAERQAVNFEVQGSAAEMTKRAMGEHWRLGLCFRYDAVFYGPIHDEVVFSVGIDDLIPFLREAHAAMVRPYGGMTVPIISSISIGLNFGEQIEVGETVDEETINNVLYNGYKLGRESCPPLFPNEKRVKEAA